MERIHHLADRPIDLFDHVPVKAALGVAAKLVADVQGHVRHVVRQIQEERALLVFLDELDRMLRVPGCELVLILVGHLWNGDFVAVEHDQVRVTALSPFVVRRQFHQVRVQWPHVIGVRQPKVFIESVPQRKELGRVTQVPFPKNRSGISPLFHQFGQRGFIAADADFGARPQRAMNADAVWVTAGQQAGA